LQNHTIPRVLYEANLLDEKQQRENTELFDRGARKVRNQDGLATEDTRWTLQPVVRGFACFTGIEYNVYKCARKVASFLRRVGLVCGKNGVDGRDMGSEPSGPFGLGSAHSRFVLIVAAQVALYKMGPHPLSATSYSLSICIGYAWILALTQYVIFTYRIIEID
jgi:hypothetical protein